MNKNNLVIGFLVLIIVILGYMLLKGDGMSQGAAVNKYRNTVNSSESLEDIKRILTEAGAEVPDVFYPTGSFEDYANFAKTVGIPVYSNPREALEAQSNTDPVNREVTCDWSWGGHTIYSSTSSNYQTGVTNLGGGYWMHCYFAGSM